MRDDDAREKTLSQTDEHDVYNPVEFDPECTFVDEDMEPETLAFHDAARDIWSSEGRFEVLIY